METVVMGWADKVEKAQALGSVDRYPRPFLKKNVGRRGRLIIEERTMDGDIVYCCLRVLIRGGADYDAFMRDQGRFHDQYAPSDEEVASYLKQRKEEKPIEPLPDVSTPEHLYLSSLSRSPQRQDGVVLESREWVERISKRVRRELRIRYGDLVQELVSDTEQPDDQTVFSNEDDPRFRILYRYFPKQKLWFIIAPLDMENPDEDEQHLRDRYRRVLEADEATIGERLLQEGFRSYPALITLDTDLWLNTQDSEEANLSLSPEEIDILNSVLSSGNNSKEAYPLFINGRPGSGKSTVLLYLFAEHLYFHLQQYVQDRTNGTSDALPYPPLYLTYSESLLNDAKRIVQDILRCDSEKALSDISYLNDPDIKEEINRAFGHFRNFLWSLLPEEDRSRFDPDKYVDFSRFRTLFQERIAQFPDAEVRNLSPEIAWHVIRSYIKGMRQDASGYIDLEYYENELPRNQQSVACDTFRAVHDAAWTRTYQKLCEEDGYWDDQDLARRLLDLEQEDRLSLSNYPAVFCDEAQDFTKLELELILHLSRYAKRSVPPYLLHKIPFAFAGDPFQTLNPTGFDWDATQASFHDNIVRQFDKAGQANLEFNFKELAFNYRSTRPIVQFCNLIQLMRGRAFGIRSLQPQKTWQVGLASDPVYFDYNNPACRQALRNEPALVIIAPCQEGKEERFVREDDFLRSIAWDEQEQTITRDVLSPMRAKGLQFKRVVLYKFGQQALNEHGDVLDSFREGRAEILTKEAALPLEYFVNGLYVAASRPRQHLMIVDTAEALRNFWSFAIDPDFETLTATYNSRFVWKPENLTKILPGSDRNWSENRDDPRRLANDFFSRGRTARDPYLLSRAIQNYEYVGDEGEAAKARALKFTYEGKLAQAGREYANLGKMDEALNCFWKAEAYQDILKLGEKNAQLSHSIRHRAADFLQSDRDARSAGLFIAQVYERLTEGNAAHLLSDEQWPGILKNTIEALAHQAENGQAGLAPDEWKRVYSQIRAIRQKGVRIENVSSLARVAFEAGEYEDARRIWSNADLTFETPPAWLMTVLAKTEPYPDNIQWLQRLKRFEEVVDAYEDHPNTPLVMKDQDHVFDAYIQANIFDGALRFAERYPVEQRFIRVLDALLLREWQNLVPRAGEAIIAHYVKNGEWDKAVAFAGNGDLISADAEVRARVRKARLDLTAIKATLIKLLARSDELVHESATSRLKPVRGFLKEQLLPADAALRARISVKEAGAAIERANHIVDALTFYEAVMDGSWVSAPETQQWARERWVKVKYRQAEVTGRRPKARQWQDEAEARSKEWGIRPVNELPRYPTLPSQEVPEPVEHESSPPARRRQPAPTPIEPKHEVPPAPPEPPAEARTDPPTTNEPLPEEAGSGSPEEPHVPAPEEDALATAVPDTHHTAPTNNGERHPETVASASSSESPPADADVIEPPRISVRIELQMDERRLSCALKTRHRLLELEDVTTQAKVMIVAPEQAIIPLYGIKDLTTSDTESGAVWHIHDRGLRCSFETTDKGTLVHLDHEPSGQSVVTLFL
ncbi:hypothetical protein [Rhodocaloribacter sp.]